MSKTEKTQTEREKLKGILKKGKTWYKKSPENILFEEFLVSLNISIQKFEELYDSAGPEEEELYYLLMTYESLRMKKKGIQGDGNGYFVTEYLKANNQFNQRNTLPARHKFTEKIDQANKKHEEKEKQRKRKQKNAEKLKEKYAVD